jgi:hypothetical protein
MHNSIDDADADASADASACALSIFWSALGHLVASHELSFHVISPLHVLRLLVIVIVINIGPGTAT